MTSDSVTHATHSHDGAIAVFLIGMRLNKPWRVDQWGPVATAMSAMIPELYRAKASALEGSGPDLGFLDARTLLGARGPTVIQYWRSADDIYAYANDPDRLHRPAWHAFYRRAHRATNAVGIWHETYAVPAGGHESLYVAMPTMGLAKATASTPGRAQRHRARHAAPSDESVRRPS